MSDRLRSAIDSALRMLEQSRRSAATAESANANFDGLKRELEDAREAIDSGRIDAARPLTEIVRWVADWIPDINDPLLNALEDVQRHARSVLL